MLLKPITVVYISATKNSMAVLSDLDDHSRTKIGAVTNTSYYHKPHSDSTSTMTRSTY
jgi:hypothetical protein